METHPETQAMQDQPDTIAEGIANLERHERDPGEQMPPIINGEDMPAEAELVADEIEISDAESYGDNRATYCPEDDKLRLYVGRVPRPEYLALKAEGWTSTPKQSCDFVAKWTPKRRATAERYAGIIEDEDASPADRAADRAERFAGYRDKRTSEATGHANRYDAGPSAYGFQDRARAVRAADRHDRIAGRAVDAWNKAEYWTRRTAGVISHALYNSTPAVRMGRIKEIEAEIRKAEKSRAEYDNTRNLWLKCQAMEDPEKQAILAARLAYFTHGDYEHPRTKRVRYLYDLMKPSNEEHAADVTTAAEACALYLAKHGPLAPEGEWLTHNRLRLAYEHQMLEAQGSRAAFVEMEAGGFLGSHQIQKVNKSPATGRVVSVEIKYTATADRWGNEFKDGPREVCQLINVERSKADIYTPPTDEQRAQFAERMKDAKKAKADKAKAKRDAGENCPLINPTDADAERLQAALNAAKFAEHCESHKRRYGRDYAEEFKPSTVCRITQARYSAVSKGSFAQAETRGLCADAKLEPRASNMWTSNAKAEAEARGPKICEIRTTHSDGSDYGARRVIILTDKPQKPLPAKVWQPYAPPAPAETLATVTA